MRDIVDRYIDFIRFERTHNFGTDYDLLALFVKLDVRDESSVDLKGLLFYLLLGIDKLCAVVFLVISKGGI